MEVVCYDSILMDPSKVLVWNVRGLNSSARQDSVRTLVDSNKADIVCLQETKMEVISLGVVLSALGSSFCHFTFVPSVGASGGILIAWKLLLTPILMSTVLRSSSSQQIGSLGGLHAYMGHKGMRRKSISFRSYVEFVQPVLALGSWWEISISSTEKKTRTIQSSTVQ